MEVNSDKVSGKDKWVKQMHGWPCNHRKRSTYWAPIQRIAKEGGSCRTKAWGMDQKERKVEKIFMTNERIWAAEWSAPLRRPQSWTVTPV